MGRKSRDVWNMGRLEATTEAVGIEKVEAIFDEILLTGGEISVLRERDGQYNLTGVKLLEDEEIAAKARKEILKVVVEYPEAFGLFPNEEEKRKMGEKLKISRQEIEERIEKVTKEAVKIFEKYRGPFSEEKYNEVERIVRERLNKMFEKDYEIVD